jgi:hypothetical protein
MGDKHANINPNTDTNLKLNAKKHSGGMALMWPEYKPGIEFY